MATIKIKFRPSLLADKEGVIYYQIIHKRVIRQLRTNYRIFPNEWDTKTATLKIEKSLRTNLLLSMEKQIEWDIKRLACIIRQWDNCHIRYTADDVITAFRAYADDQSLFHFMYGLIVSLKQSGKYRTSETYRAALKSFAAFRKSKDILLDEVDSDIMILYESYLKHRGLMKNSISFYMRILKAVYHRAVEKNLCEQKNPFRHVYTGVDKTLKRAVPLKTIRRIKDLDLSSCPSLDYARDMFLFSFYTRGMSFIDMAYLKKDNLHNGILSYRRHKTGQRLFVKWERCMQEIVDKYDTGFSYYLLPILKNPCTNERSRYKNTQYRINKNLKEIAKMVGITMPFTFYVGRHSWASIAKNYHVPLSVISEGLGHDSELTTRIYLASLDNSVIDKANALILRSLWEPTV